MSSTKFIDNVREIENKIDNLKEELRQSEAELFLAEHRRRTFIIDKLMQEWNLTRLEATKFVDLIIPKEDFNG